MTKTAAEWYDEGDWLEAEKAYLAQRPEDGSIPRKQLWHEETIERLAWEIYLKRQQT